MKSLGRMSLSVCLAMLIVSLAGCGATRPSSLLQASREHLVDTLPGSAERSHVVQAALLGPVDPVTVRAVQGDQRPSIDQVLSVEALVAEVLARNPSLTQMVAAWQAATARYPQVRSLDDPMLSGMFAPASFGSNSVDSGYRIEVSQKIPFPGKLRLRGQGALAEASAAQNDVEDMRIQLVEAAQLAYYDYYLVGRALSVNDEGLKLLKELKESADSRYKTGLVPQQDVLQADVEIGRQRERGVTLERMRKVAVARINTLRNLDPTEPIPPPPVKLDVVSGLPPVTHLREHALSQRPDLKAQQDRIAVEQAGLALAFREFYPDVEIAAAFDTMPQGMEVEGLAVVVLDGQEVAFLSLGAGIGIVLQFVQPLFAGRGQVPTQHFGNSKFIGHGEHGRPRRLRGNDPTKFDCQVPLNVLPGSLVVLRGFGAAANIGLVARQEQIGLREAAEFVRTQSRLNGSCIQRDPFKGVHPFTWATRKRCRPEIWPFRRRQHSPTQAPVGLGAWPLHAPQGIVGQLSMIGQPFRERLQCYDAGLRSPRRLPAGLDVCRDSVQTVGRDVARLLEIRRGADFPDEEQGTSDMPIAALPSRHHRFEVGQMRFDGLGGLGDERFLPGVDDALSTKGNVGQLVGQDPLRRCLVRRLGAMLPALARMIVPSDVPRTSVLPFEDAAFAIAAIACFRHDAFPLRDGRPPRWVSSHVGSATKGLAGSIIRYPVKCQSKERFRMPVAPQFAPGFDNDDRFQIVGAARRTSRASFPDG